MRDPLRHAVAEFVGTFALVFVGGLAILYARGANTGGLLDVALAHGFILAVMVSATMRVSGHLNPAVTLGFLATRRIAPMMAGIYIIAQLLGAMVASYAVRGLSPADAFTTATSARLMVAGSVSTGQAIGLEAIATFFLVFVVYGTAVDPQHPKIGGLAIGLTVAAGILAIGSLTGAALNPARAFGPAFAAADVGRWEGQIVWWAGPILGGVAAALIYDALFLRRGIEPVDHGEIDPRGGE